MIVHANEIPAIEALKARLNLNGDVYVIDHIIESLDSHRRCFPLSTATTIEEAEQERLAIIKAEKAEIANSTPLDECN